MRILVAPDKFKGSLGAREVAAEIASAISEVMPDAQITTLPIADGGEGTAEAICSAHASEWHACDVHDALGHAATISYCTLDRGEVAVCEMSAAAGLWRVPHDQRNPEIASSFGVGEMLLHIARTGAKRIIIGLGGSATNDGGFDLARALGFRFIDAQGAELSHVVTALQRLARIERPLALRLPQIKGAADVRNPLLGSSGATRVFGRQKGATPAQVEDLERALERLAAVVTQQFGSAFENMPGAGAAGGLGFGLMSFCGGSIYSGFDVVAEQIGLEAAVCDCDVVIAGEGCLDAQTQLGKAPSGIAQLARKYGKRIYAIVGEIEQDLRLFDAVFVARPAHLTLEEAITNAKPLVREAARRLAQHLAQPDSPP